MKRIIFLFLLMILQLSIYAQYIGIEKIDEKKIKKWDAKKKSDYQGIYQFGFSEWESNLIIIIQKNVCYVQLRQGRFNAEGSQWFWSYKNFRDVYIKGNMFYSKMSEGLFVTYNINGIKYGLRINQPWNKSLERGAYEIGKRTADLKSFFPGKYPQASYKLFTENDLKKFKKSELKIMRNEIFARYGYIFEPGGDMEKYFSKRKWYKAQYRKITRFLTGLEKKNIKLIKEFEKSK